MGKQVSIEGGIYVDANHDPRWGGSPFTFFAGKLEPFNGRHPVMPFTLTFTLPEGYDERGVQIEALKEREKELQAQFTAAVTEIHSRINKLQALEFTEAA